MRNPTDIGAARQALGRVGAFLPNIPFAPATPVTAQRHAVTRLERGGYTALWVNEGVGGKDVFVQLATLLAASERITFGSAVASIWARPPATAHGAAALLEDAYPGRTVLGLGVGYPEQAAAVGSEFGRPLSTMRRYLEQMDEPHAMTPAPDVTYPRILGANGPRMLGLAGKLTDGAIPTLVPAEYTRRARAILGPDKLLVVGLAVVADADLGRARDTARLFASQTINRPGSPYAKNLADLGYTGDELVEAVVPYGGPAEISAAIDTHLEAGADHVRISVAAPDFAAGIDQLEWLAGGIRN
ncbi:LLM class flavin-dependent oxidoreductase [Rhodococcoides yunnanense]|uniref:LLM class flavin-dependent oxidoreductase n=1 Tax=Rhodococcoides yunnanense TaxID=278209 RepID=UPI000935466F|nr:LLM class flavin-dependent oxidoreductase [Rhodococcus yunnanensis]